MRRSRALIGSLAILAMTKRASASPEDAARAEQLYEQALSSIEKKGDYASACPKFEASQRLDPALGTQFNLADCWEHVGLRAASYRLFAEVSAAARTAGNTKLSGRAQARVAALESKVGRIKVIFASPARLATIKIDTTEVSAADGAAGYVVEPGAHVVEIDAPGKTRWSKDAEVVATKTVDLAVFLADAVVVAPKANDSRTERDPRFRAAGVVLAGVGLVGIGVGTVFGLAAMSKRSEAIAACHDSDPARCQDRDKTGLWDDAKTSGNVSTIAFVAGGALALGGAALWLFAPSRSVTINGAVDAHAAAIDVRGVF